MVDAILLGILDRIATQAGMYREAKSSTDIRPSCNATMSEDPPTIAFASDAVPCFFSGD